MSLKSASGLMVLLAGWLPALLIADDTAHALVGLWQHESQPVVVEIKATDGLIQGVIARQDEKPDAVGKTLFRDLEYDPGSKSWSGRIFVLKLEKEKNVRVVLESPEQFEMTVKAGFIKKTVTWKRVETLAQNQD